MDFELLRTMCAIPATAGDEGKMQDFVLRYLTKHSKSFKTMPQIFSGAGFQDMVIAVFGEPRTAIFAHMDTVGYCVAHHGQLVKVGNPKAEEGTILVGEDEDGEVECILKIEKIKKSKETGPKHFKYKYEGSRTIAPGTPLTYKPDFKETGKFIKSAYLDDRLGVWNALQQAHSMEHGAIVFSTYEETGGGGAQFAGKFLQDNFGVQQALISDVTLVSDSIKPKKGVAISMRDRGIPRQSFVRNIIQIARKSGISFQLEVEDAGGSDGTTLQNSSYMWDWCFIGPPEENYHQPGEKVAKSDIEAMVQLYRVLIEKL